MSSSGDDFFKGLLFGAVIGATAGILLAPQSGVKTREDIKKLALDMGDKAQDLYSYARKQVEKKIKEVKAAGKKIDFEAYKKLVMEVVDEIKNDSNVTSQTAKQIGLQLNQDWNDLKSSLLS
ncbi:MAG TPA: YtxH domain-containing protein [Candidatus Dojkabacteria bacterium]|nr:YtxH domain-containing protein [Candidatus Dojkabacteria bacterium]